MSDETIETLRDLRKELDYQKRLSESLTIGIEIEAKKVLTLRLRVKKAEELIRLWRRNIDNVMARGQLISGFIDPFLADAGPASLFDPLDVCPFCKLWHNPEKTSCDRHDGEKMQRIRRKGPITAEELAELASKPEPGAS